MNADPVPQKRHNQNSSLPVVVVSMAKGEDRDPGGKTGCLRIPASDGLRRRLRAVSGQERGDDGGGDEQMIAARVHSNAGPCSDQRLNAPLRPDQPRNVACSDPACDRKMVA